MGDRVLVFDKDIKMAVFFLTSLATVLESAQIDLAKQGQSDENFDDQKYKEQLDKHEQVFDMVSEDFNNSMFGQYSNSVSRAQFELQLMSDGWKYFDLNNLNMLFSIKDKELKDNLK